MRKEVDYSYMFPILWGLLQSSVFTVFSNAGGVGLSFLWLTPYIPASSKGCCLNPKGWCIGTPYHPFSSPWKIQVGRMPLWRNNRVFVPPATHLPHLESHSGSLPVMDVMGCWWFICYSEGTLGMKCKWITNLGFSVFPRKMVVQNYVY